MKEKQKRPRGRPKFEPTEDQIKQIAKLYGLGLTYDQLASYLEISAPCFDQLLLRRPDIKNAISKSKSTLIGQIAGSLAQQAIKGNLTAIIFYLKTQGRWAEAREQANNDDVESNEFVLSYRV